MVFNTTNPVTGERRMNQCAPTDSSVRTDEICTGYRYIDEKGITRQLSLATVPDRAPGPVV
jgi:hypothetical protein